MYKLKKKQERGITLIALVITIIVLLILAGVTIAALTGDNGILIKATNAREKNAIAQEKEYIGLAWNSAKAEKIANGDSSVVKDSELNDELKKQDKDTKVETKVETNDLIATYEKTKRQYTISQSGKIKSMLDLDTNMKTDLETGTEVLFEPHTITYDANGGEGTVESQTGRPDDKIILRENGFTRAGYSFVGWDTDAEGNGRRHAEGAEIQITEDMTLYAYWNRDTVTLKFDNNGGTGIIDDIELEPDVETTLPSNTFTRDGYRFAGWKVNGEGNIIEDRSELAISEDTTLYAQWIAVATLKFDNNGGTGTMNDIEIDSGVEYTLPINEFTMDGYKFTGWKVNGEGDEIKDGGKITINEETTLYAQWLRKITVMEYAVAAMPTGAHILEGTDETTGIVMIDSNENEWVWIEVPEEVFTTAENEADYNKIKADLINYTSIYRDDGYDDYWYAYSLGYINAKNRGLTDEQKSLTNGCGLNYDEYKSTYEKMLSRIYINKGFYISRYEIGAKESTQSSSKRSVNEDDSDTPMSKMGQIPYYSVTCSQAQGLARSMSTGSKETNLLFGIQWGAVCKYLEENVNWDTTTNTKQWYIKYNSTSWGNFNNSSLTLNNGMYWNFNQYTSWRSYNIDDPYGYVKDSKTVMNKSAMLTTGASEEANKMNIYDFAGNFEEWTLEMCSLRYQNPVVSRGACYYSNSSSESGFKATGYSKSNYGFSAHNIAFRVSLY